MKRLKHRSAQPGASDHAGRKGARPLRSVLASLCAVAMSLGMASASVAAFADDRQPTADAAETGAPAVDETAENNAVENEPAEAEPAVDQIDGAVEEDAEPTSPVQSVPSGEAQLADAVAPLAATSDNCSFADAGSGTYASTICWIDMSNVLPLPAENVSNQEVSVKLLNQFDLTMRLSISSQSPVRANEIPTWNDAEKNAGAYLGNKAYTGIAGKPAIYCTKDTRNFCNSTITIDNIGVKSGDRPVQYSLVIADAEATNMRSADNGTYRETMSWTASSPLRLLNDDALNNAQGSSCTTTTPPDSTTWTCEGNTSDGAYAPMPILAADNPSSMSVRWTTPFIRGRQGIALGVLVSSVAVEGKFEANENRYRASNDDTLQSTIKYQNNIEVGNCPGLNSGGVTTAGSSSNGPYRLLNAKNPKSFTVTDNLSNPSMYVTTMSCTNGVESCGNKVKYIEATGDTPASAELTPAAGDNLKVTFTHTPIVAKISFTKQVEADDPANAENNKERTFTFTGNLATNPNNASIYNQKGAIQQPGRIDVPSATITGKGSQNMALPRHDNTDLTNTFALQKGGEYTFTVQEQVPTDKDQYIKYDDQPRTVTVKVANDGTVTTTNGTGGNTFVNRILAKPKLTLEKTVVNTWAGGNGNTPYAQLPSAWQLKANDTVYSFTGAPTADDQQNQWVQQSETKAQLEPRSYTLSEAKAPKASAYVKGYSAGDWSCTDGTAAVAVTNNVVTLKPGQNVVCSITNTAQPATLTWSKVNLDGDTIGGSEWSLTGTSHTTPLAIGDNKDKGNDEDTAEGALKVSNLKWGEYTLTETKAPDGYITPTGTSAQTKVTVAPTTSTQNSAFAVSAGEIVNHKKVSQLPFTGEQGATPLVWLAVAGGLGALAVLSAVGISAWRRRRML
ncbi:SpaA isopeptide-forming pilin-related protein [Bifidobacterium animalis]|nr:SpaA isopeptide-forming pilin-related protein [Bifidobacterium animalis]